MTMRMTRRRPNEISATPWLLACAFILVTAKAHAQGAGQPTTTTPKPTLEIYGFGQADAIVDFDQNNPDWYDVLRPSRLPAFHNEFGQDGHFYLSPRQSRFGAR